jgi:hypothetical protein
MFTILYFLIFFKAPIYLNFFIIASIEGDIFILITTTESPIITGADHQFFCTTNNTIKLNNYCLKN